MKMSILVSALLFTAISVQARDYVSVVGSSTVYPFATVVAERLGATTDFKTPKVESTGSGGGIKLFCAGVGVGHPDIVNSSRAIKDTEIKTCVNNGVTGTVEVKIGYDGIVIANALDAFDYTLTLRDVYLALAKDVPNPDGSETFVPNPYQRWSDVSPDLPDVVIEVLGPPPTSGTRDAFVELAMEGGAKTFSWVKALKDTDEDVFKTRAYTLREDGKFIEAGENDNLIVQKLLKNRNALGVFGFSFLDQNLDVLKGAPVDGIIPDFDTIADGSYPVSRSLYFYVKGEHVNVIPGIKEYVEEFMVNGATEEGYLADRGLIPLPTNEYEPVIEMISDM